MTDSRAKFIRANMAAQAVADSANVAYWLECHSVEARHHEREIDTKFRQLADELGYVVAPKVEIAA